MTLAVNDRLSGPYIASAGQTVFTWDFPCEDTAHLLVVRLRSGVQNALVEDVHYAAEITGASSGTITLFAGAAAGDEFVIAGDRDVERSRQFLEYRSLSPAAIEKELDLLAALLQEFGRDFQLTLKRSYFRNDYDASGGKIGNVADGEAEGDVVTVGQLADVASGAASAAIVLHEADANPHPQYVRSVNSTPPDAFGNVLIPPSGGGDPVDHGALAGLNDDDHPHYLNAARADAWGDTRYSALAHVHAAATVSAAGFMSAVDKKKMPWTPFDYGAIGDGVTDDTVALQTFFDAVMDGSKGAAVDCTGNFAVSGQLFLGPSSGFNLNVRMRGEPKLTAIGAIAGPMLTVRNMIGLKWDGQPQLWGTTTGSQPYPFAGRTCRHGVRVTRSAASEFHDGLYIRNFAGYGIYAPNASPDNSNGCEFGHCQIKDCGSGQPGASLTSTFSSRSDTGATGSPSQRSVIGGLATMPPTWIDTDLMIGATPHLMAIYDGQLYFVYGIDRGAGTVSVFPWLPLGVTSGTLTWVFGGGAYLQGGDSGQHKFSRLNAYYCGIPISSASLYGPSVQQLVAQNCGLGLAIGGTPVSAGVMTLVKGIYCENNVFDIVKVSSASNCTGFIAGNYTVNLAKCVALGNPRLSSGEMAAGPYGQWDNLPFINGDILYSVEKYRANGTDTGSAVNLKIKEKNQRHIHKRNSWTVNLSIDADANNLFGYDSATLVVVGTGAGGAPTGTITFAPPGGATVNGGATAAFSGITGKPATFVIYWEAATDNYLVNLT